MKTDPYATEIRYSLDLLAWRFFTLAGPQSLRIASDSPEIVKALVRRLTPVNLVLYVENRAVKDQVLEDLGIETHVTYPGDHPANVALFPFSLDEGLKPSGETYILAACWNAFSYKNLLYPGTVKGNVFTKMAQLRHQYRLEPVAGLYSPGFIFRWSLAKAVEGLHSSLYFRLEDAAMQRLIDFGPLWRLSYIVVLTGCAAN